MKTLKRFFDDIHRIANVLEFRGVSIFLCADDRIALVEAATKFRRNGPRIKKEVGDGVIGSVAANRSSSQGHQ